VQYFLDLLATTAGEGSKLSAGAAGLPSLQSGIAQAAGGAAQLAGGSGSLVSGANGLASGAYQLAAGSDALVSGANGLASGASELATGLQSGADQVPAGDSDAAAASAEVAADPVTLSVTTDNPVSDIGQIVATFFVPLGLWLGALAVFLVLRPVTTRLLSSTARDGRLVASTLTRASLVTGAQAVLLVALLHGALGVGWELLPATLGFSLLTAIAFTAFHYLLTVGLGRAGLVVSLFVLAIQITSTGGIYPIEVLSSPFQVVSPFLPLTYAVDGMQGILAGGNPGGVVSSAVLLLAFGAVSVLLSLVVIGRTRRARALGLVPTTV
jgi:putative membrane protein